MGTGLRRLAALCLLVVGWPCPHADAKVFLMYSEKGRGCLESRGSSAGLALTCNESSSHQQWKWVSRLRLFNLGSEQCLSTQRKNETVPTLGMTECDQESAQMRWHCNSLGRQLNSILNLQPEVSGPEGLWKIYNTDENLCSRPYHEIYTIQGNSHGKPCTIPFTYDDQWFHDCTTIGREDGHLWCATTVDYRKDERWGFCPIASDDCETFWDKDPLTNSCYQFNFQSTLSWSEARTSCQQQSSDLLSITELHEQTYINGLLTGYSATLWIGLNVLDIDGGWQWSDGAPLKYLNWESDQPANSLEENCGVIRAESSGRWQNKDCGIARPYVCKKKPKSMDAMTTDICANRTTKCNPGWLKFRCNCYRLNKERKSWQESQKSCMRSESNLVSIHHLAELEFILTQVKQDVEELWIGLNDIKHQMNFEWSDGTRVRFTYWHPFEPNNFASNQEDCITLWGSEGRWNDGPCNLTLPSICKKPGYISTEEEDALEDNLGCAKGWRLHSSSCYFVGEETVTFDEALKKCTDQRSTLVTILNRFEQSFIISLILGRSGNFWTGLQDANHPGAFQWMGGDAVSFTNWNRNQPGYKGGCVVLATGNSVGLWEVKDCSSFRAKYICRQNLATSLDPGAGLPVVTPTPSVTGSCPSGWISSPTLRYCYKVFHSNTIQVKKNWVQAHMSCHEQGAHLLSISSFEEEKFAEKLVHEIFGESEDHEYHWFWLGLNRRNPGADWSWTWSDGTGYSYNNFGRNTYDDDNIRRCAVTDIASSLWRAVRCEIQLDWICKIRKGAVVKEPEDTEDNASNKWVRFKDAEYKLFEHRTTWPQARRICTWFRAELASIHNQQELAFLGQSLQELSRGQDQFWWIGLHTYENDGRFRWSDGSLLNFVSWASGRPRPVSRDRKCVYMSPSKGVWADQRCLNDLQYICKRTNTSVVKPPVPPPPSVQYGGCPKGWIPFVNKCFQINGYNKVDRVNWIEAKAACERAGGLLATISNYHEQAFITAVLPNITFDLWIGLHDTSKDFQWLQKKPLKYVNWAPGEPSGQHTSSAANQLVNCVVIWHALHPQFTGRWDDRSCTIDKNGYICQRSKDPSLPSVPARFPPPLTSKLTYMNSTFRVIQKPLTWQEAAWLCETRNETLVTVVDPYHQAYLTQVVNSVQLPLWIGLSNEEGDRTYSWLSGEELFYTNWQDGEPHQVSGCAHMDLDGTWQTSNCDTKLMGAVCRAAGDSWFTKSNFSGSCPTSLEDSSWIPFRDHCYTFHLEKKATAKDAAKFCQKVRGAEMLSILDETENVFIWEHLQTFENDIKGAWLSLTYNKKGGSLVWPDKTPLNYSNWGPETDMSLMSPNTCYWIRSYTGIWGTSPCIPATLGIICKMARVQESDFAVSSNLRVRTLDIVLYLLGALVPLAVVVVVLLLYRQRAASGSRHGAFESARYSRTSSTPSESVEKNILVSDMEMNEQQE